MRPTPEGPDRLLLSTSNLFVGYKEGLPLLKSVDLSIPGSAMIALLGSNGSGKTSLVRTLTGLIAPLRGEIHKHIDTTISLVPQMKNLKLEFPMSVRDSLSLSMSRGLGFGRKWNPDSEDWEVIERTGIGEFWDLLLRECSGGQLQRFLIARSLLSKARLIFLDEPLDALDKNSQESIIGLLKDRQDKKGLSFFIITHNLNENWRTSFNKIYKIDDQSLIELDEIVIRGSLHDH